MLTEPLYQALQSLGLRGMARQYSASEQSATQREFNFNERMALLIDAEQSERANYRYAQRIRWAKLSQTASIEDLDSKIPRGLDKKRIAQLTTLQFIKDKRNILITGPTGIGKSYLACAIGQHACRENISVRYLRLPRLIEDIARAEAIKKKSQPVPKIIAPPRIIPTTIANGGIELSKATIIIIAKNKMASPR